MPDAATTAAPTPTPIRTGDDPRFARTPMVRQAMILLVPTEPPGGKFGKVELREVKHGGRLTIEEPGSGIERSIDLNVREMRQLSDHLNRIARRVATRPEWKP